MPSIHSLIEQCRLELLESHQRIAQSLALLDAEIRHLSDPTALPAGQELERMLERHKESIVAEILDRLSPAQADRVGAERGKEADLVLDRDNRCIKVGRRRLQLTETEYEVLALLLEARPNSVSRADILLHLYGPGKRPSARTIDVFISHIRQKLALTTGDSDMIEAVRGEGWRMRSAGEQPVSQRRASAG